MGGGYNNMIKFILSVSVIPNIYSQQVTWSDPGFVVNVGNGDIFEGAAKWNDCPDGYVLGGFWKNSCQQIHCLEEMKCVRPEWYGSMINFDHCYIKDIWGEFDSAGTSSCDTGYFIHGIYTSSNTEKKCELFCIEELKCCKYNENVVISSATTTNKDWWGCFDGSTTRWCTVDSNQFITGLYRGPGQLLSDLEEAQTRSLQYTNPTCTAECFDGSIPRSCESCPGAPSLKWVAYDTGGGQLFEGTGKWYVCANGYVLGGFWRNACQSLDCLEHMKCIRPGHINAIIDNNNCYEYPFDHAGYVECSEGYFIRGIWSKDNPNLDCGLDCWEKLKCCKYDENIISYGLITSEQNWWSCFDGSTTGWCQVDDDKYITGLFRSAGNEIYNLEVAKTRKLFLAKSGSNDPDPRHMDTQVVGGNEASWELYPYVVHISPARCSGSIISMGNTHGKGVILTAAHCEAKSGFVYIGCKTVNSGCTKYEIGKWIPHKDYFKGSVIYWAKNDIALIVLKKGIYTLGAKSVTLAQSTDTSKSSLEGLTGSVLGYGISQNAWWGNDETSSGTLRRASVKFVSCGMFSTAGNDIQCTEGDDGQACNGDSGGPALKEGTDLQVGVIQAAFNGISGSCGQHVTGVLTYIPEFDDWIKKYINNDVQLIVVPPESWKISISLQAFVLIGFISVLYCVMMFYVYQRKSKVREVVVYGL